MEQDHRPPTSSPRTGPGGEHFRQHRGPGLIRILAVIAEVVLLVTGRYPVQIFDFALVRSRKCPVTECPADFGRSALAGY